MELRVASASFYFTGFIQLTADADSEIPNTLVIVQWRNVTGSGFHPRGCNLEERYEYSQLPITIVQYSILIRTRAERRAEEQRGEDRGARFLVMIVILLRAANWFFSLLARNPQSLWRLAETKLESSVFFFITFRVLKFNEDSHDFFFSFFGDCGIFFSIFQVKNNFDWLASWPTPFTQYIIYTKGL